MEGKKISFGFMKTKKAARPVVQEKVDYIECVEEKAIKVVGGEPAIDNTPLIIPMKPNTLITAEKLKEIAEKVEEDLVEPETTVPTQEEVIVPENETLEQMAVRELMQDAQKEVKVETTALTVPIPSKPVIDGQKESTLEDYDSIPVQDFGMAMLRGMGWAPGKDQSKYKQPQLRPKGLGLGADKVVKDNQKKNQKSKDEDLSIVKNAFVKITSGKHSGFYGKVVSLDEDNGRVMVDITIKKTTVSLSEFMMQPVTKEEFDKESKVINQDSYEEYKKNVGNPKSSNSRQESSNRSEKYQSSHSSDNLIDKRKDDKNGKDKRRERSEDRSRERDDRKDVSEDRSREKKNRRDVSGERVGDRKRDYSEDRSKDRRDRSEGRSKKKDEDRSREKKRDSSEDRPKRRDRKKYSSNDSLSSSDSDKRKKKKNKNKCKSSDSDSSAHEKSRKEKRDIDKKRKGKKKKRDRDRSPNYKKHRK